MAEQLKNVYSKQYLKRLSERLAGECRHFDQRAFVDDILGGDWGDLELKQRMSKICRCMHEHLNMPFEEVAPLLVKCGDGFGDFAGMFFPEYVETYGKEHWSLALDTLEKLTCYSSSEFAIRTFIVLDEKKAMKRMLKWSRHSNEHIRRLASEGCRPRLPWSFALESFKKDPAAILPILENLKSDDSLYVRKSVANNLNDISKDHPKLVLKIAKKWMKGATPETKWIVKHALRTLLKAGEPEALLLFGYGNPKDVVDCNMHINTPCVVHNESLEFEVSFQVKKTMTMRLEYALHFLLKNGKMGRKVFKISEKEVEKGSFSYVRNHLFKTMTTRKYNEGLHLCELIINGKSFVTKPFFYFEKSSEYSVYLLSTMKGSLYCGIAKDLNRRFLEHRGVLKGGAKFTKAQKPWSIVHVEKATSRSEASKREAAIKKLSRPQKEKLISHSYISSSK